MREKNLLDAGQYFDRMGITTDHLDFDKFSANMRAIPASSAQGAVNRALYASMAAMQAKQGAGAYGEGGLNAAERAIAESEYSIYLNIARATANILAVNTIGNYVAGKAVPLPYVLFGFNDSQASFVSSLKNVMGQLNTACPGITYTITSTAGTQIWTWTLPSSGKSDVVTIAYAGSTTTYTNIVTNQSQDPGTFYCDYVNYVISDATNGSIQGLQSDLQFVTVTSGGAQQAAELLPNATKTMSAFLPDRWDVFIPKDNKGKKQHFDATLGVVDNIIACPATDIANGIVFSVQWNMFCYHHENHKSKA